MLDGFVVVLFAIDKDVLPTALDYSLARNETYKGQVTVTIDNNRVTYPIVAVKVSAVDKSNVYAKIRIEGLFVVPRDFSLNELELGGYRTIVTDRGTVEVPHTAVKLGGMAVPLARGGYYISVTVTLQSPANFDFYVA